MRARPWLRFGVGEREYALPLSAIAEVTSAARPRLIPFVPLATGGVVNFRGEPLPVVESGALLDESDSGPHRHLVVLDGDGWTAGLLVGEVHTIERELFGAVDVDEVDADAADFAEWVLYGGKQLGLLQPAQVMQRARELLAEQRQGGNTPCLDAF